MVDGVDNQQTAPTEPELVQRRDVRLGLVELFPRTGLGAARTWNVAKRVLLGRRADAEVCLPDTRVSRQHAHVSVRGNAVLVEDLGSRHGTSVDGVRVGREPATAEVGAVIRVGDTLLLVVKDSDRYAAPFPRLASRFLGLPEDAVAGPTLWEVWQTATRVAALPQPVLLLGESGSGKEIVARLLHRSAENRGPFVAVNVAAIPEGLFESEIFGHSRGAFTGATSNRAGAFREAEGGLLFLDEIGDLRADLQVKLLRAIDQLRVRPLGENEDVTVRTRVVAATSRDLRAACDRGEFRKDLYYRLSGIVIEVPPLRSRREEIVPFAASLLAHQQPPLKLSPSAAESLTLADWPGNVRQLHNTLVQAVVAAKSAEVDEVRPEHLPVLERTTDHSPDGDRSSRAVTEAMANARGNARRAAQLLGVSRATLYNLFKRHGVDPREFRSD